MDYFDLISYFIDIQYNTVKPKTFKPNLLNEPKDISSPEFFFIFTFLKPKLSLNQSKTADPLRFGLTVLYCISIKTNKYIWKEDHCDNE